MVNEQANARAYYDDEIEGLEQENTEDGIPQVDEYVE